MNKILNLYKAIGETPLERIERFRAENFEYKEVKMTYAGRLDPMAEGVLIVLTGDEVHNKEKYLGLDKDYEVEIAFGISSDTYDALGIVKKENVPSVDVCEEVFLKSFVGKKEIPYPPYSSKTVSGKPLFQITKDGDDVEVPTREMNVRDIELLDSRAENITELAKEAKMRILKVKGEFRQSDILASWENLESSFGEEELTVLRVKIGCDSGTYMRSIAEMMGKKAGSGAIAFSIKRTRVGEYKILDK